MMDTLHGFIIHVPLAFMLSGAFIHSNVRSFLRNFVPFIELLQSFTLKQLEWSISHQPLIRKHSYLDHSNSRGSAFIPCPGVGLEVKNQDTFKKCFSTFSVMETTYADSWWDMAQPCDMDLWVMNWRSAWPIFYGPLILPYILKTIWCMYIILWEYESIWPQN